MHRRNFTAFLVAAVLFYCGCVVGAHAGRVHHGSGWRSPRAAAPATTDQRLAALKAAIEMALASPLSPSPAGGKRPHVSVLRAGDANGLKIIRKGGGGGPSRSCRGASEAYSDCGADCELVCGRPMPEAGCRGHCKPGCICRYGYIRSSVGGPCVPVSKCQPDCGPNRKFEVCASLCPAYCDVRPRPCLRLCRMNACACADGYLLARNGTTCLHRDRCKRF